MEELTAAIDLSSSLLKAIFTKRCNSHEMRLATLDVEMIKVLKESLDAYQQRKIKLTQLENDVYLQVEGSYYALGGLARDQFKACDSLKELKYERGAIRIIAMIGLIAQKLNIQGKFLLNLGVLLPWGEINDRKKLQEKIEEGLKTFKFRSSEYEVALKYFSCLPEGAGVMLRGKTIDKKLAECRLLVLSIGYRNISYLIYEEGKIRDKGAGTSELGFISLLDDLISMTSGFKARELMPIVLKFKEYQSRNSTTSKFIQRETNLLRSMVKGNENFKESCRSLIADISLADRQYWLALSNWMRTRQFPSVDEVIVTGGTAHYLHPQIEEYFKGQRLSWAENLEGIVRGQLVDEGEYLEKYRYRLTDNCGFFFHVKHNVLHHVVA